MRKFVFIVIMVCLAAACVSEARVSAPIIDVGSRKQLFIDKKFIAKARRIKLTVNPPVPGGVAIDTDKPWDGGYIDSASVLKDATGKYRAYYACTAPGKNGNIGRGSYCLATSADGIKWEKPNLGLVEFEGSKNNNILSVILRGHVFLDPKAEPDKRYKHVTGERYWGEKRGGMWVAYSADGINWKFNEAGPRFPFSCDTFNIAMYDPRIDKYIAYLRMQKKEEGRLRQVGRVEVDDIMDDWPHKPITEKSWFKFRDKPDSPPVVSYEIPTVLNLDRMDPADTDIYAPGVDIYPWADNVYIAMITPFRHTDHYSGRVSDGPVDIQLAVSRDGIKWSRPDRKPYIRLNLYGQEAGGSIYGAQGMIRNGNEIYQYYCGYGFLHAEYLEWPEIKNAGKLYRVTQRLDGFVSADFGYTGGTLTTPAITFKGNQLQLNIDCSAMGFGRVEIRDENDKPIPGYTLADCDIVDLNHIARTVTWKGKSDLSQFKGPVKLHFDFRATKLYAFQFVTK